MVDTINPNTNEPDVLGGGQPVAPVAPTTPEERFYGGFDKPDETKINLAESVPSQPTAAPVAPLVQTPAPVHDVSPVQPAEVRHTSYVNTADAINWRGILVICAIGLALTLVAGLGIYFGISASNAAKLKTQQTKLDAIKSELSTLKEPPVVEETPTVETPTTTPVEKAPVVTPAPVETPQVPVPDDTNQVSGLG